MKDKVATMKGLIDLQYEQTLAEAELKRAAAKEQIRLQKELTDDKVAKYQDMRHMHRAKALKRLRRGVKVKENQEKLYETETGFKPPDAKDTINTLPTKRAIKEATLRKKKDQLAVVDQLAVAPVTLEMMTFRKMGSKKLAPKGKETNAERMFLNSQQQRFDLLATDERIAIDAGYLSPHLVLLSERWNNHTGKKTSQKTLNLINDAVLDLSPDGHPVRFLVAKWDWDQEELLARMLEVVTEGAATGHPQSHSKIKSIAMMVNHSMGSLFPTAPLATTCNTICIPTEKSLRIQKFWTSLDAMLSATGPITEFTGEGCRSECMINCVGQYLEGHKPGTALMDALGSMLQTEFVSVMAEGAKGKDVIERYFDWDKYLAALAHGDKKRKKERLGYDEDVFEKGVVDKDGNVMAERAFYARESTPK